MKNKTVITKTAKIALSLMTALCLICSAAFASEGFINVSYNAQSRGIQITTSHLLSVGDAAIVHIAPSGAELGEGTLPVLSDMFIAGENGSIDTAVLLPDDFANGKFGVYVYSGALSDPLKTELLIFSESSPSTVQALGEVADADSLGEFRNAVREGGYDLGIDVESETSFDIMTEVMYGIAQKTDSLTFDIFSKSVDFGRAAAEIMNETDIDAVMQKYAPAFDTTYSEFSSLDENIKNTFCDILAKSDFNNGFITFDDTLNVAKVVSADGYGSMRDFILDNTEAFGIDISGDYESLSVNNRSLVFKNIYEVRSDFKTCDDVREAFEDAVYDVVQSLSAPSGGGSGSGGGKGSGGGSFGKNSYSAPVGSLNPTPSLPEQTKPSEPTGTTTPASFSDIENHFAAEHIKLLSSKGIINGFENGTFMPNESITRAQMCKIVALAFGIQPGGECSYSDVSPESWYYGYVAALSQKGIIMGNGNGFAPDEPITRQDAAVIVARVLDASGKALSGEYEFADNSAIAPYAIKSVTALASAGYLKGDGISFRPADFVTRGETAALIGRIISKI